MKIERTLALGDPLVPNECIEQHATDFAFRVYVYITTVELLEGIQVVHLLELARYTVCSLKVYRLKSAMAADAPETVE